MYERNRQALVPRLNWRRVEMNGRNVYASAFLPRANAIVIATDDGVWASTITQGGYTWVRADGLPPGRHSSVLEVDGHQIVAAAWGADVASGHYGLFVGKIVTHPRNPLFRYRGPRPAS